MSSFGDEPAVGRARVNGEFVPASALHVFKRQNSEGGHLWEKLLARGTIGFGATRADRSPDSTRESSAAFAYFHSDKSAKLLICNHWNKP